MPYTQNKPICIHNTPIDWYTVSMKIFRKAAYCIIAALAAFIPLHADGIDMSMMNGAIERQMERELSDVRDSLASLNESMPDRVSPGAVIEYEERTAEDTYSPREPDPILREAIRIADGTPASGYTFELDPTAPYGILSLEWMIPNPGYEREVPEEPEMIEEAPDYPEHSTHNLGVRLDLSSPVLAFNGESPFPAFDPAKASSVFGGFDLVYSWDFAWYGGVTAETGVKLGGSAVDDSLKWYIPLTAGYTFLPYLENSTISVPITISAGGFLMGSDADIVATGPMVSGRIGLSLTLTDSFSLTMGAGVSLLVDVLDKDIPCLLMLSPMQFTFAFGL